MDIQTIPHMSRDAIYRARHEIGAAIADAWSHVRTLESDMATRAIGNAFRRDVDAAELALLDVTRPR